MNLQKVWSAATHKKAKQRGWALENPTAISGKPFPPGDETGKDRVKHRVAGK